MKKVIVVLLIAVIAIGACRLSTETTQLTPEAETQEETTEPVAASTNQPVVTQPTPLIGTWEGTTSSLVVEGQALTGRVVWFEISEECVSSEFCLYGFGREFRMLTESEQNGHTCFGDDHYTLCFAPVDENTLNYFAQGDLWPENAKLHRRVDLTVLERRTADELAISPNGNFLANGGGGEIRFYSTSPWELLWKATSSKSSYAFSPDGRMLAVGTNSNKVEIWDPLRGTLLHTLEGGTGRIREVLWSPNNSVLVSRSSYFWAPVWNTATWELVTTIETYPNDLLGVGFSENGESLLVADDAGLRVYDTSVLAQGVIDVKVLPWLTEFQLPTVHYGDAAFSPDGRILATASRPIRTPSGGVNVNLGFWDTRTGKLQLGVSVESDTEIRGLTFSPDGTILAGVQGTTILLWDTSSGDILHSLDRHKVFDMAWWPNGEKLVIGGSGELFIWEINSRP